MTLLARSENLVRLQTLTAMLQTMRPMGSKAEVEFRRTYLEGLPGAVTDPYGNLHVMINRADDSASAVLWSSHTDTVHHKSGAQRITIGDRLITLAAAERRSNCLGADDTIGVWIMREMILANVPGHYVFHFGEERGGIGSSAVVLKQPDRFAGIKYAIAFDRRGKRDIITHQAWRRTCSDAFAKSLCKLLRRAGRYRPSDGGIYTDTAEYAGIVSECTNVSVGYQYEHTKSESADYWHALRLLNALLAFDESKLVAERRPGESDNQSTWREDDLDADITCEAGVYDRDLDVVDFADYHGVTYVQARNMQWYTVADLSKLRIRRRRERSQWRSLYRQRDRSSDDYEYMTDRIAPFWSKDRGEK